MGDIIAYAQDMIVNNLLTIVITGLIGYLVSMVKKLGVTLAANNEATFVILQDRILQLCKYHITDGYISPHDAEMLQKLAEQYYAMGGNGYVKQQVTIALSFPQEPQKDGGKS